MFYFYSVYTVVESMPEHYLEPHKIDRIMSELSPTSTNKDKLKVYEKSGELKDNLLTSPQKRL